MAFNDIYGQVALEGLRDLCGATDEEIEAMDQPVAELISVRNKKRGRTEEFACIFGYEPPEGTEVISRRPLYLHPK
jgi:hypothetical protein